MPNFQKLKMFPHCNYSVSVFWEHLESNLKLYDVDLDPDFQRGHVWTPEQQASYILYQLRGGTSGKDVYLNMPSMGDHGAPDVAVLVDGKQRIEAVRSFLRGDLVVMGARFPEWEGCLRLTHRFEFHVAGLQTRKEVLEWYLDFNSGGTVHSPEELSRVRELIKVESPSSDTYNESQRK